MTIFVCFYDDDAFYDSDVPYDGLCPPAVIVQETPLIITGRTEKKPPSTKEYCYIEIDSLCAYVNGELIKCSFKPIRFECEEDVNDIPRFMIDYVKFSNNNKLDNVWFDVSDYQIKQNNFGIQAEYSGKGVVETNAEISIGDISFDDLEIIVESIVKKGSR